MKEVYKVTEPVVKYICIRHGGCLQTVFDSKDDLNNSNLECDEVIKAKFWLECDESLGQPLYFLTSNSTKLNNCTRSGYSSLEEAIELNLNYL